MPDEKHEYHLFLDGKRFEYPHSTITGAQVKALGNIPAEYQLFLEEEGDTPDKPISDAEAVSLEHGVRHFYAVPPATFG